MPWKKIHIEDVNRTTLSIVNTQKEYIYSIYKCEDFTVPQTVATAI
jgi:hypothetical protein